MCVFMYAISKNLLHHKISLRQLNAQQNAAPFLTVKNANAHIGKKKRRTAMQRKKSPLEKKKTLFFFSSLVDSSAAYYPCFWHFATAANVPQDAVLSNHFYS